MYQLSDHKLKPSWINANPDTPLRDIGLSDFELVTFIKKYGPQLKCLNLIGQIQDGDQLKQLISFCPHLTRLSINSDKIKDDDLALLKDTPLINIKLSLCHHLTDNALAHLREIPLTSIAFNGVHKLTDNALTCLKGMRLTSVSFSECKQLTDNALFHLKGMPLTSVDFSECPNLTDNALAHLKGMPLLTHVNFAGCGNLPPMPLLILKKCC